jgi:hypothetical protein
LQRVLRARLRPTLMLGSLALGYVSTAERACRYRGGA